LKVAKDGQLQIIKQAGHLCNLEQPEAFNQQVRTFAKRLSSAFVSPDKACSSENKEL